MKKVSRIICLMVLAAIVFTTVLTGCGSPATKVAPAASTGSTDSKASTEADSAVDTSKEVELSMYLIGSPGKDYDLVLAEFNKKAKADLNATLKVNWIGWGDFQTKYPLVLASGEPIDLIYTSTWLNYYQQAQKGAFMPLEEIGPKYAPKSFADEPEAALKQATVNGHIYALPPNYTAYATLGMGVRGDLMKKYGISEIKNLDDFGKYLDAVVKNDKNLDPAGMYATQHPVDAIYFYQQNLYPLAGDISASSPFWIDFTDPNGKVVNVIDKTDLPEFLKKMKDWSTKGYWPKSVLSNKDDQILSNGKAASLIHNLDSWVSNYIKHPEWDMKYTNSLTNSYPLPYMQDGMAIPVTAKNPERALMLLEKLRNDQEYYNLLTYGIEGKHYKITADDQIKALDQEAFTLDMYCGWGFRETKFRKEVVGSPLDLPQVREQIRNTAKTNIYTTFSVNLEPIKSEYAAILSVIQQYYVPLILGYTDPVKGLETLKEKMKSAGAEKVQAEIQKQVDEFRKNNQ